MHEHSETEVWLVKTRGEDGDIETTTYTGVKTCQRDGGTIVLSDAQGAVKAIIALNDNLIAVYDQGRTEPVFEPAGSPAPKKPAAKSKRKAKS